VRYIEFPGRKTRWNGDQQQDEECALQHFPGMALR
jgi:hypothetical protein